MESPRIDAVYPLGPESVWNFNEIRYSLRSLEKNFPDLGQVWVLGSRPNWMKNVRHIPYPDPYKSNKDANLIQKIIRVCMEPELSQKFLFMSDDQYLLKPMKTEEFEPFFVEMLHDSVHWDTTRWAQRLKATYHRLHRDKKPTYNYEGHIPYLYDKTRFPDIMLRYNFGAGIGYTINTLYFNNILDFSKAHERKNVHHYRCGIYTQRKRENLEKLISRKIFLSHDDKGLNQDLKNLICEFFPEKSRFEE